MEHERANAASRVKAWTRGRFGDVTVLVTELESALPGFPPLRTVVAFWSAERRHYHFSVFKPLESVEESDLSSSWYRDVLVVTLGIDCSCC